MNIANQLNQERLKNKEYSIISWIRVILSLSVEWIREFLKAQIHKITWWNTICLFGKIHHPFENFG
jgi:hypothetical protein